MNKIGLIIFLVCMWTLAIISICVAGCNELCKVEKGILYLMRRTPNSKLVRNSDERKELAQEIILAANEWNQSAYLLTAIFYSESTFDMHARGSAGEIGIGQVGNTSRAKCRQQGYQLGYRVDQIKCTAYLLHDYQKKCGTVKGAVTAYAGWGQCTTRSKQKQRQVQYKLQLAEKLQRIASDV